MKDGLNIDKYGTKRWYQNGQLHREDGPAVEYSDGDKFWCQKVQLHREDDPAIEYANDNKFWYLRGKQINTQQEFETLINLKAFW